MTKALLVALLPAAAVAGGNYWTLAHATGADPLACVACVAWLVGGPFVLALLLAVALPGTAAPAAVAATPEPPPSDDALRLLAVLQEEGRLVDFLTEDLSPYSDEQIGAATRGIQESCRKALRARVALEPVLAGAEGETVEVPPGFDPSAIRLSGSVTGSPPFRGVLRHPGWRATRPTLPERRGQDPHVIAPAEVEIA
ncbi:MAG TPA: DUF2760 domain-containing protein [Candidatus Binatia bacterium]|jgi:hypothetical protein|nr:DUF2760 domain-containing protein [Candidatus Binatia bacterium]